jgi:hypothetical protein
MSGDGAELWWKDELGDDLSRGLVPTHPVNTTYWKNGVLKIVAGWGSVMIFFVPFYAHLPKKTLREEPYDIEVY